MKQLLLVILLLFFVSYTVDLFFYNSASYKTSKYLKEDIELALHDAGLFLDEQSLSEGYVIFDKTAAYQAFRNSIYSANTQFYKHPLKIVLFEIFDESNTTFPFTYTNHLLKEPKVFTQPTIYVVVETYGVLSLNSQYMKLLREGAYTHHLY